MLKISKKNLNFHKICKKCQNFKICISWIWYFS